MGDAHAEEVVGQVPGVATADGRFLPVPGTLNFRDAGGYPVQGGGMVAWRRLLRSDALHRLDPLASDMLRDLNLRTVLDLRTSAEAQIAPSPLDDFAKRGALTTHISLIGEDLTALPADLSEIYSFVVDERGAAIGAALRSLARPGALPGLVHCTAGKDRTGIVVAFTLAAIGVPDQFIAADYALSSRSVDPLHTPTIRQISASSGLGDQLTAAMLACPPDLILTTLERARRHGGSVRGYLAGHGVSSADVAALRAALVIPAPPLREGG